MSQLPQARGTHVLVLMCCGGTQGRGCTVSSQVALNRLPGPSAPQFPHLSAAPQPVTPQDSTGFASFTSWALTRPGNEMTKPGLSAHSQGACPGPAQHTSTPTRSPTNKQPAASPGRNPVPFSLGLPGSSQPACNHSGSPGVWATSSSCSRPQPFLFLPHFTSVPGSLQSPSTEWMLASDVSHLLFGIQWQD